MSTKPTLEEFREAVYTAITGALAVPTHPTLPDDVAELPCAVVGLPSWSPDGDAVTELELDVWLIARRQTAGGTESELLGWAQQMIEVFGGTRDVIEVAGVRMHMSDGASRVVDIAGHRALAYQMTVLASAITC